MKFRISERGAGLIETMVAVGVMGMVAYFVVGMLKNGTVGQKSLQAQDDSRSITEAMAALLSDPVACQNTFGGKNPAATSGNNNITIKNQANGPVYVPGNVYGNRAVRLKDIVLGGSGTDPKTGIPLWNASGTGGTAFVSVIWVQTGTTENNAGPGTLLRYFLVRVSSMGGGLITACTAEAAGGGAGFWKEDPTSGSIINTNINGTKGVAINIPSPPASLLFDVYGNTGHALVVDNNGKVGIGTMAPTSPFQIASGNNWSVWTNADVTIGDATNHLNIGVATGGAGMGDVRLYAAGGTKNRMMFGTGASAANDVLTIEGSKVGILTDPAGAPLTVALEVNGDIKASGSGNISALGDIKAVSFISTSDERLKTDVHPSAGLEKILQLRGVTFRWLKNNVIGMGLIAQEVEKVFPSLVVTDAAGFKGVRYESLIAPLIEAVKQLYAMVREALDLSAANSKRIAALEAGNAAKDAEIRELARRLDEQAREIAEIRAKAAR